MKKQDRVYDKEWKMYFENEEITEQEIKIQEEMDAIKDLVTEYSVEPLSVPFLTEDASYQRNLVIIKREKVLYQSC